MTPDRCDMLIIPIFNNFFMFIQIPSNLILMNFMYLFLFILNSYSTTLHTSLRLHSIYIKHYEYIISGYKNFFHI